MSELVIEKAKKYLTEGRVKVEVLGSNYARISVLGSSPYQVQFNATHGWGCSCPAQAYNCAHVIAAKLITHLRPEKPHIDDDSLQSFVDTLEL